LVEYDPELLSRFGGPEKLLLNIKTVNSAKA
jgi:hypothetical protein